MGLGMGRSTRAHAATVPSSPTLDMRLICAAPDPWSHRVRIRARQLSTNATGGQDKARGSNEQAELGMATHGDRRCDRGQHRNRRLRQCR